MPVTSVSYFTGTGQPAFTTAVSVGLPRYIDPPEGVTEFIGVQQKMWQVATAYTPPTLSTVATYLGTTCYLTGDSGFGEVGGGVLEFTREYRRIPSTRNEYSTIAYSYPAYKYNTGFGFMDLTGARTQNTSVRDYLQFYLCEAGETYTSPASIPVIGGQRYILTEGTVTQYVDFVLSSSYPGFSTNPTLATYSAWVGAGTEIIAEDSTVARYAGNIYMRSTKYIVAK